MLQNFIYVKLIKEWGGFKIGDVIRFGETKGRSRIALGFGVEVKKQRAVNDPPEIPVNQPVVETADASPAAETAVINPILSTKDKTIIDAQVRGENDENKKKVKKKSPLI